VLWTCELGTGYSGFAVVGGRVFTQAQSFTGQHVVCLDAQTGAEIWRQWYDLSWKRGGAYPGPYATPTWHQDKVYYASPSGLVGRLDAATGRREWSVNVLESFGGKGVGFGYACTPLVEDGKVILPVGGVGASVVALDARDGRTVWRSGDDEASYCPAYAITFRGRRLVVAFLQNALVVLDLQTGKPFWRQAFSTGYDEHSAWPLYQEPYLLACTPFRTGAQLFRLDRGNDGAAPTAVWASRELSNDIFSSVLVDGHVYGFDITSLQAQPGRPSRGRFKCLELTTGKVRWATEKTGHATALAADGKLVLFSDTGTLLLARASPEGYEELARQQVLRDGLCWTPPALYRGRVYLRNHSRAVCVFLGRPDSLGPRQRQGTLSAADLPGSKGTDWTWVLTREPEYPNDAPTVAELARWYAFCLVGVFGGAALVAGTMYGLVRLRRGSAARRAAGAVFGCAAFGLGLVGTPLFSALDDGFVQTWPASLFTAYQATLATITWAERQAARQRARRVSRLAGLGLLALCFGYYELCSGLGLMTQWGFLFGFLPAWPLAVWAARGAGRRRLAVQACLSAAAFTVYFWTSGLFIGWKTILAG
jgi:outer membrane protein assembly factor BamB